MNQHPEKPPLDAGYLKKPLDFRSDNAPRDADELYARSEDLFLSNPGNVNFPHDMPSYLSVRRDDRGNTVSQFAYSQKGSAYLRCGVAGNAAGEGINWRPWQRINAQSKQLTVHQYLPLYFEKADDVVITFLPPGYTVAEPVCIDQQEAVADVAVRASAYYRPHLPAYEITDEPVNLQALADECICFTAVQRPPITGDAGIAVLLRLTAT